MKTKYIKVAVSERLPKEEGKYTVKLKDFGLIEDFDYYDLEDFHNDWKNDIEYFYEEVPNHEAELVEMLMKAERELNPSTLSGNGEKLAKEIELFIKKL